LKLKIQKGEYSLGELIVPKKYKKMVIDQNGNIQTQEFTVEGRKNPLDEIRKKMLLKHKKFIRQHPDEYYDEMTRLRVVECLKAINEFDDTEGLTVMRRKLKRMQRQRHLMLWHDHSTVTNHGHLVFMVASIYDPALYLTNDEYFQSTGVLVDIQTEVEKPEIYIVGRCRSSDAEQLAYVDTRCECLRGLSQHLDIIPGVAISDVMRFFKGDGPAVAFESGQQKGGHYFCSVCGMHAVMSDMLDHVFRCRHVSLKDKQQLILKGPSGRQNSLLKIPKPLQNLNKEELYSELRSREIYPDTDVSKSNLKKELASHLQGVQGVPALLYSSSTSSFQDHSIDSYEALACEPMHDISNHIGNILEELPNHITKEQKVIFNEIYEFTLGGKETKRATDHRYAIIMFAKRFKGVLTETQQLLLNTVVEMQDILYSDDNNRCPRLILRYHNLSFMHFLMCTLEFGSKPAALTARKLYGKYLHNLVSHQAIQLRIISGTASNAENEERVFNAIKGITNTTSNYRPSHVISNIFLRLQAEEELGCQKDCIGKQNNLISKSAASMQFPNTIIPSYILEDKKYSSWWQAHLERISDFLLPGEGVWWKYVPEFNEVEFFDAASEPCSREEGPLLHHFRSSSLKLEESYLAGCWDQCIQQSIPIPAHFLNQPNADGAGIRKTTGYLSDQFKDSYASFVLSNLPRASITGYTHAKH